MPKRVIKRKSAAAKWKPLNLYQHQQDVVHAYKTRQLQRFFLAWHRRAGKDTFGLDFIRERMQERIGNYWHLFPFHVQAKRAIWKGIDARTGERFIDRAFPPMIVESTNDTDMSITITGGSTFQMLGSDNYDRMVGSNPCGILFSEWALCDPAAWDYIRPILIENKGWAMFITTFRGRNHAYRMFETIKELDSWYADLKTIDDTYRHDGKPIVTKEDVEEEIRQGMDPSLVQQEFYCDPDATLSGAIFQKQHGRMVAVDPQNHVAASRVARVAWGMHDEGIAAVVFQDMHIIGVHTFIESNLIDASQQVMRRHPSAALIHHAVDPDPSLFRIVDGAGLVAAPLKDDPHQQHAHAAALLNACSANSASREKLVDFTLNFAPFRDRLDDYDLSHDALMRALAVMNTAGVPGKQFKRIDYSRYDRGVI